MIFFKPSGTLDIANSPPQLPDNGMQRAKNLKYSTKGNVKLRDGSYKLGAVALSSANETIDFIIEHGGDRYYFAEDGSVYMNEFEVENLFESGGSQLYDVDGKMLLAIIENDL